MYIDTNAARLVGRHQRVRRVVIDDGGRESAMQPAGPVQVLLADRELRLAHTVAGVRYVDVAEYTRESIRVDQMVADCLNEFDAFLTGHVLF